MKIHILGVAGTFMAGVAQLAQELGHEVTGSDIGFYSPMREQLQKSGVKTCQGYNISDLPQNVDLVIIGNALSRGNEVVEYILNNNINYISGPEWIYRYVLYNKKVIAVSGTHGKTSTTSLIAWLLEALGFDPGFLIGGVANNFESTARLGGGEYFVIESDEYDSAFFDKRPKFLHYRPKYLAINNLEFDHADIYDNLEEIKKQFGYLIRTVPQNGCIVYPEYDNNISDVIKKGFWSELIKIKKSDKLELTWNLIGEHNQKNALIAYKIINKILESNLKSNIDHNKLNTAFAGFLGVKRRLEFKGEYNNIRIYDDFAHHPTAISLTLQAVKNNIKNKRIVAVIDFRSFTMRTGAHDLSLFKDIVLADQVFLYKNENISHDLNKLNQYNKNLCIIDNKNSLISQIIDNLVPNDVVIFMSNNSNDNILEEICDKLS